VTATRPDSNTLWVKSLATRSVRSLARVVRLSAATTTPSWHTTVTASVTPVVPSVEVPVDPTRTG
jgi:hypothetical protein